MVAVVDEHGCGGAADQLRCSYKFDIDDGNQNIVECKIEEKNEKVIVGGPGPGNRLDQLNGPIDVLIDKENNSVLIADQMNQRVVRCC